MMLATVLPGLCPAGVVSDLSTSASEFTDPLATSTPAEVKPITPPPISITVGHSMSQLHHAYITKSSSVASVATYVLYHAIDPVHTWHEWQ